MSIAFEDLKPRRFYAVMVDFVLMDAFRYSYDATCNRWEAHTRILPEENWPRLYVHPSTPATGASLMQNVLTFKTLKLTNCPVTAANTTQVKHCASLSLAGATGKLHDKFLSMQQQP